MNTYPLPAFLAGKNIITASAYAKWLHNKADTMLKRDRQRRARAYVKRWLRMRRGRVK